MDEKLLILIAEDSEDDSYLVKYALRKAGLPNPTHISTDGEDVIRYLKAEGPYADRSTYPFPRVLIIDLKMPRLSGFDVLRWIKENDKCSVIPTIVLTSSAMPGDVKEAYRLGANAFLVKRGNLGDLQHLLECIHTFWSCCELPEMPPKC